VEGIDQVDILVHCWVFEREMLVGEAQRKTGVGFQVYMELTLTGDLHSIVVRRAQTVAVEY
jgi:hypothetical protein